MKPIFKIHQNVIFENPKVVKIVWEEQWPEINGIRIFCQN